MQLRRGIIRAVMTTTFNIRSADDQMRKLAAEIEQAESIPLDDLVRSGDQFVNCAITAWHVLDWIYQENAWRGRFNLDGEIIASLEDLQRHARKVSPALVHCYQIATGAKHGLQFRKRDPNVRTDISVVGSSSMSLPLQLHKLDYYGTRERPLDVFKTAMRELAQIIAELR
jgi:hypothetical protein